MACLKQWYGALHYGGQGVHRTGEELFRTRLRVAEKSTSSYVTLAKVLVMCAGGWASWARSPSSPSHLDTSLATLYPPACGCKPHLPYTQPLPADHTLY
jgi:hypothetical protein